MRTQIALLLAAAMRRTGAVMAILLASMLLAGSAAAQQRESYDLQTPLPTDSPGKIEVVEFFWYGCPHCYALEPSLEAWVDKLPSDVSFKRVPAIYNENWAASARVYYTLESLGQLPKLHRAFFDAIHKDGLRPTSQSAVEDWMKAHGVDVAAYRTTAKSFATDSRMKRAQQLIETAKIDGVPAIVIQGRTVVPASASPEAMLGVVDRQIDLARKAMPASQASQQSPRSDAKTTTKPASRG